MLDILEIDERFGLARGEQVVIPAIYDAVWPLLDTFWGIRAGNVFGVLAADGSEICSCVLPATNWGFAQLQVDQELEAALATESTFVNYLQTNFAGLQTCNSHEGLFQPARWWAETVTPHLVTEQGELYLYSADQCLVLSTSGSWSWLDEAPYPCVAPLLCVTHTPVAFTEIQPQESREFQDADIRQMLYWHLRLTSTEEPTHEEAESIWLREPIFENENTAELEEVLISNGIAPAVRQDVSVETPILAPAVRLACEKLLLPTISAHEESRAEVNQLIYLAWLWANGFVHFDGALHRHAVDTPYHFDMAPINLEVHYRQTTLNDIYEKHKLGKLFPLLRTAPRTVSR